MTKIKIALADDHQIVLDGLHALLQGIEEVEIVAEANNGKHLIDYVAALEPDIVLIDLDMPVMDGFTTTEHICKHFPDTRVIILTMHKERALIQRAMDNGASAFLLKTSDQEELRNAIRKVYEGGAYFSTDVSLTLLHEPTEKSSPAASSHSDSANLNQLTEREREILRLIAEGLSNKEVGERLYISHRTVDTHRSNIMRKLDVHNLASLIRLAVQTGLIDR